MSIFVPVSTATLEADTVILKADTAQLLTNNKVVFLKTWIDTTPKTVGGTVTPTASGSSNQYGGWALSETSQHCQMDWGCFRCPKTANYSVLLIIAKNTSYGIIVIRMNGTNLGTGMDGYAGAPAYDQSVTESLGELTAGTLYSVATRCSTKNAGSSNYTQAVSAIMIYEG